MSEPTRPIYMVLYTDAGAALARLNLTRAEASSVFIAVREGALIEVTAEKSAAPLPAETQSRFISGRAVAWFDMNDSEQS